MEKKQSFLSGAAILGAAVAITKVLGAIYKIPLGNLLDSDGMAHFYVAYNVYSLLLILSTAGLPLALSRLVAEAGARNRVNQQKRIFRTALVLLAAIGLLCAGAMWCFPERIALLLRDSRAAESIRVLAPAVLCVCISSALRGYTQGQGSMTPTAVSQVVESTGKLAVGLGLAWILLQHGAAPQRAAAGAIAGVSAGAVLSLAVLAAFLLLRRRPAGTDLPQSRGEILRQLLLIGVPITVGAAGMNLITLLDQTLVLSTLQNHLGCGEAEATVLYGQYTFGMTLFNLPSSFIYPVSISLMPALSAALVRRDRAAVRQQTATALRLTALLALPAGVGLSVLAEPILHLLYPAVPETAVAAAYHLRILGIACIFVCLMVVTGGILQACGKPYIPMVTLLCGGALKIAVNYWLVADPAVGIRGAAVGTLCCYGLIAVLNAIAVHRVLPEKPDYLRLFGPTAAAAAVMALAAWGIYRLLGGGRMATVLAIAGAVIVYAAAAVLLGAVTREDVENLPILSKIAKKLPVQRKKLH